jgi:glucose uptake protein GlcU
MVPNKDLVFATIAGMLVGRHAQMAQMLALVAGMILVVHAALILGLALQGLLARPRATTED